MKFRISAIVVVVVILSSAAFGFDGQREGFLIGFGTGVAYASCEDELTTTSVGYYTRSHLEETGFAVGSRFAIGAGLDETSVLALELNGVFLSGGESGVSIMQGYIGPVVSHYSRPTGKSLITAAGLGLSFNKTDKNSQIHTDLGALLGLGVYLGAGCEASIYGAFKLGLSGSGRVSHHHFGAFISAFGF